MTLDEARETLGVTKEASVSDIRDAFRRRARAVHPDRHPGATGGERARFARDFDRARAARDILVRYTSDALRKPVPTTGRTSTAGAGARTHTAPGPTPPRPSTDGGPAPRRERARPRTSETRRPQPAPRVTMRFDEFVSASDAAGFGIGRRSRRKTDWARVIAWSTVGVCFAATIGGIGAMAYTRTFGG